MRAPGISILKSKAAKLLSLMQINDLFQYSSKKIEVGEGKPNFNDESIKHIPFTIFLDFLGVYLTFSVVNNS